MVEPPAPPVAEYAPGQPAVQHIEENLKGRIIIVLVTTPFEHVVERALPALGIANRKGSVVPGIFINRAVSICETLRLVAVKDIIWALHLVARHFE